MVTNIRNSITNKKAFRYMLEGLTIIAYCFVDILNGVYRRDYLLFALL